MELLFLLVTCSDGLPVVTVIFVLAWDAPMELPFITVVAPVCNSVLKSSEEMP